MLFRSKIYEFSNGDIYIGKIVNGKMDGIGTYNFVEGIEYIGELSLIHIFFKI